MLTKTHRLAVFFLIIVASCAKSPHPAGMAHLSSNASRGYASWYGKDFHGKKTSSGEVYDMHDLTAAHRKLPFGTLVKVSRDDGRSVVVKVNDRGPFVRGRILDVSYAAAKELGLNADGVAMVQLQVVGQEPSDEMIWLQLGSYREERNAAQALTRALEQFPQQNFEIKMESGLHRLMSGPFQSEDLALALKKDLKKQGTKSIVVRRSKDS